MKTYCNFLIACFSVIATCAFAGSIDTLHGGDFNNAPTLAWKFKANGPFFGSPIIDGQTVYVAGLDSTLYALDLITGKAKCRFTTHGPMRATPCINGMELFLNGGDGNLYALDKNSGKLLWKFTTGGERLYDPFDYYQSSPVFYNDVVYFGSGDSCVYAVKAATGKMVWRFATKGVVHNTVTIGGNKLFVGSYDGNVYALNIQSGQLIWKFKTVGHNYFPKGELEFSPTICNGLLFISGRDYNLYALDLEKGYCHWNRAFERGWATRITASLKNDSLIYVSTSDDYLIIAMRAYTGEIVWKTNVRNNIMSSCALTGGMGYLGTLLGKFYGFDLTTGAIKWTFATDGYNDNHLKYYKADDSFRDDIYSIILSNEALVVAQQNTGGINSTPAIANDLMVVSSTDGTIYCVKK